MNLKTDLRNGDEERMKSETGLRRVTKIWLRLKRDLRRGA